MRELPFFQVDAFAGQPFEGNPAAVMPLEHWLDNATLQAIAAENNLSETAFAVRSERDDSDYELRWFTPTTEVDLCGHATLASAHVLIEANASASQRALESWRSAGMANCWSWISRPIRLVGVRLKD